MRRIEALEYRDIVNSLRDPVLVVDRDLIIQFANLAFYQLFNCSDSDTIGKPLFSVQSKLWATAEVRPLLESVLHHDVTINKVRLEETFPIIGRRVLNLSAKRVSHNGLPGSQMIVTLQDVTQARMIIDVTTDKLSRSRATVVEVNHRVKNNLASIRSMLRLEAHGLEDQRSRDLLDRIGLRVGSMVSLYELLTVGESDGTIEVIPYFEAICAAVSKIVSDQSRGWSIEVSGDPVRVDTDVAVALGAVVNELVTNAAKYAFLGRQDIGQILVRGRRTPDGYHLSVSDNGVGIDLSDAEPKSTGMGMRLVDLYAGTIGSRLQRETGEQGTKCWIVVPWSKISEGSTRVPLSEDGMQRQQASFAR